MTAEAPEPGGRDYVREMRDLIDAETADGSYAAPVVAARIVVKLRATDSDLLAGWLDLNAVTFVREAIGHRDRSIRGRARGVARRGVFGKAAEDAESGDSDALGEFLSVPYVVNDKQDRKPLARMVAADLLYVARDYESDAKALRMEGAFFRALAKRVGRGTVGNHFTEEQIAELRASIVGG